MIPFPAAELETYRERFYGLLSAIHRLLKPRTYLEIGVGAGGAFGLVRADTIAVGVDPAAVLAGPLPPNATLHRLSSDEFFARPELVDGLGGPVELAFLDGMHLFEFALRDFANLERLAAPAGVILVHDCLPVDPVTCSRDPRHGAWAGDVWKLLPCLARLRPDLEVTGFTIPPTGLAVVTGLDPDSTVLLDRYDELVAEYASLSFPDDPASATATTWRTGTWSEVSAALTGRGTRGWETL